MDLTEVEFKKLLLDLGVSLTDIANSAGISSWAVTRYFRGELKDASRRRRIRRYLERRARARQIELPEFWAETESPV